MSVTVVFILVKEIALATVLHAKSLQVWNNLSDLEGMGVIRKWERGIVPENLVCDSAV